MQTRCKLQEHVWVQILPHPRAVKQGFPFGPNKLDKEKAVEKAVQDGINSYAAAEGSPAVAFNFAAANPGVDNSKLPRFPDKRHAALFKIQGGNSEDSA